jgi:N-acetylmuramoyl-L-alanine amidase
MRTNLILISLLCLLATVCGRVEAKPFTLVIDAGHGGHDAGAVGAFSKEKTINLNVALAFGRYVERNCRDVRVIYTRKSDVFVTLHGRADIANKAKADLFISIHTNSLPKGRISRGMETYTLGMHRAADNLEVAKRENEVILQEKDYKERYQGFDPNSSESYIIFEFLQDNNMQRSVDLAKLVQTNVCSSAGRPNKGVKQAGFLVLRETSMPSCLIELGFISTPDEERLLNNDTSIDNIARGIYNAFIAYKRTYSNDGITYSPEEPSAFPDSREDRQVAQNTAPVPAKELPSQNVTVSVPAQEVSVNVPAQEPTVNTGLRFKVQIFVSDIVLKTNDSRFKGRKDAEYYTEGGMVKYTIGESADFNEMNNLRRQLDPTFRGCFVIAFKDGHKMDINEALREWRKTTGRK